MNIKIILLATFILICIVVHHSTAQAIKNEVQIIEASYGLEKKSVIEQAMNLSGKDALLFWAIYDEYEDKRSLLGEQRLLLIHDYVIAYPTLTDAKSAEITLRCFKNDESLARLHKKYYKKIRRRLSPLKAAQFVQAEHFLQNVVRVQLESQLPFIGQSVPTITNINDK